MKLKKTLKTLSSGQKNPKKTQKNPKNPKKTKKTHWAGFFLKKPGFFPTLLLLPVGPGMTGRGAAALPYAATFSSSLQT
jgi:hypothetical protein